MAAASARSPSAAGRGRGGAGPRIVHPPLELLPVLPLRHRLDQTEIRFGRIVSPPHELTRAYQWVAEANGELEQALARGGDDRVLAARRGVQRAIQALFGLLHQRLFGKEGLIRQAGLGRRVDGAVRLVIVPNPNLAWNECRLPLPALAALFGERIAVWPGREAVAAPDEAGRWRALNGNQVGVLLARHVLETGPVPGNAFLATTHVSTRAIEPLAAHRGVEVARTHTGFKWMAAEARLRAPRPLLFAFEEAIGAAVRDLTRDKDGLAAGLVAMEAHLSTPGGLWAAWRSFAEVFGGYASGSRTWTYADAAGARRAFEGFAASDGTPTGFRRVNRADHRRAAPPADLIVDRFDDGSWVAVRPSGTEPKLKLYYEAMVPAGPNAAAEAEQKAVELGQVLESLATG